MNQLINDSLSFLSLVPVVTLLTSIAIVARMIVVARRAVRVKERQESLLEFFSNTPRWQLILATLIVSLVLFTGAQFLLISWNAEPVTLTVQRTEKKVEKFVNRYREPIENKRVVAYTYLSGKFSDGKPISSFIVSAVCNGSNPENCHVPYIDGQELSLECGRRNLFINPGRNICTDHSSMRSRMLIGLAILLFWPVVYFTCILWMKLRM